MNSNGDQNREQSPLLGVVLCCTFIPPELRTEIADVAEQMGAVHTLDLTADVTHLLVGNIDTPKYKYVAKERVDIKVLFPSWVEAVRQSWMQGGETDVTALEEQHKLPALQDLQICVTGFEDLIQRTWIADTVSANGANYHGDLTKQVTHLIAAAPRGKKYEYAGQWRIKIVTIEWLQASLERGMALDEALFHPIIPVDERGQGAVIPRKESPHSLGKRGKPEDQQADLQAASRRKLRRTTSSRLESQHDNLWDDIGSGEQARAPVANADWAENPQNNISNDTKAIEDKSRGPDTQQGDVDHQASVGQKEGQQEPTIPNVGSLFARQNTGDAFHIYGFDSRKQEILRGYLLSNGARVLSLRDVRDFLSNANGNSAGLINGYWRVKIIVPHDVSKDSLSSLQSANLLGSHISLVTDWYIEKCLHGKSIADSSFVLYQPLKDLPIKGFEDLTICPTSFRGIDLLHFSKAVKLAGATYDECLKPGTSVMVCSEGTPNADKLAYAVDRRIPIVTVEWFYESIRKTTICPYDDFQIAGLTGRLSSRTSTNATELADGSRAVEAAPGLEMSGEKEEKLDHKGSKPIHQQGPMEDDTAPLDLPLQDLPPQMNSPKKPSGSRSHSAAVRGAENESNEALPLRDESAQAQTMNDSNNVNGLALSNAIELLRAQRKGGGSSSVDNSSISEPKSRRHRQLGRASSNPSSNRSSGLSRRNSVQVEPEPFDSDDLTVSKRHGSDTAGFRPSQALTYEDPEALAAREKLMKRMGASAYLEDDKLSSMQPVESIGLVKDASFGPGDDKSRRRPTRKR